MFRFDLSLLTGQACRSAEYVAMDSPNRRRSRAKKKFLSSPARTARTQDSSHFSDVTVNADDQANISDITENGFDLKSSLPNFAALKPRANLKSIPRVESNDSASKRLSSVGMNVLKRLRKQMSLIHSTSFDSQTSRKSANKRLRKRLKTSFSILPQNFLVSEIGGQGFEITPRLSRKQDSEGTTSNSSSSDESDSSNSKCEIASNDSESEIVVPKILRETLPPKILRTSTPKVLPDTSNHATSTFATTSLTSGEATNDVEIVKEDADIRKLCNLMEKIRSNNDAIDKAVSEVSSTTVPLKEIFRATFESPPPSPGATKDLMMFVNNEQTILEYTPDEL